MGSSAIISLGGKRQGPGQTYTPGLATAELVWITVCEISRQTHRGQQFGDFLFTVVHLLSVYFKRLGQKGPHLEPGAEAPHRVLKHHGHRFAVSFVLTVSQTGNRMALEIDSSLVRLNQTDDGTSQCGLARTGFSDQAEGFPVADRERHTGNRFDEWLCVTVHQPFDQGVDAKTDVEIAHL